MQAVGLRFGFYGHGDVRAMSVKQITSPISYDALGHCVKGGLYDPSLGPTKVGVSCPT